MRTWGIVVGFVAVLAGCNDGPIPGWDAGPPRDARPVDAPADWYHCDPVRCGVYCLPEGPSCGDDPACTGCVPFCGPSPDYEGECHGPVFRPVINPDAVCGEGVSGDQGSCLAPYKLDGGRYGGGS